MGCEKPQSAAENAIFSMASESLTMCWKASPETKKHADEYHEALMELIRQRRALREKISGEEGEQDG